MKILDLLNLIFHVVKEDKDLRKGHTFKFQYATKIGKKKPVA